MAKIILTIFTPLVKVTENICFIDSYFTVESFYSSLYVHSENLTFVSFFKDDMLVRIFNYNTLERVHQFEAHTDYVRSIAVHPTQPYILTSSGKWHCHQDIVKLSFVPVKT